MTVSDTTTGATSSHWLMVLRWVPRLALALIFAGAGFSKIAGDPAMIELFSAIGVLVPRLCGLAATGLALLMIGATIVNVAVLGVSPASTLFLFALAAVTAWLRRHQFNPLRAGG